jgi:hypothetical protein
VPDVPPHELEVVAFDAYPAAQEHGTLSVAPPAHALPAPHPPQVPLFPAQPPLVGALDANPGVQVHENACAAPPAHPFPAPQTWHVPRVSVHPTNAVAELAFVE